MGLVWGSFTLIAIPNESGWFSFTGWFTMSIGLCAANRSSAYSIHNCVYSTHNCAMLFI